MLIRLTEADGVILDLRYATADNLTGTPIYQRPVALLRPEARDRLLQAANRAAALGLRFRIFDAFRPLEAQQALWDAVADKRFVAPPSGGGTHPRGIAVDLTLTDPERGDLPMGTGFDAMIPESAHDAVDLPAEAIRNRALLLGIMTACGWAFDGHEWWHYHLPGLDHLPALSRLDVPDGPM